MCTFNKTGVLSQTASFMQWMVTILFRLCHRQCNGWFFLHFHEMTQMPIINMYPVLDCQSFASSVQFASQNPIKVITFPLRHSSESKVFFKCLIMRFIAIQCGGLAFDKNWLTRLTANVTSTFVATIAYIRDPTPALYGTSFISFCTISNSPSKSLNNFEFTLNGVTQVTQLKKI